MTLTHNEKISARQNDLANRVININGNPFIVKSSSQSCDRIIQFVEPTSHAGAVDSRFILDDLDSFEEMYDADDDDESRSDFSAAEFEFEPEQEQEHEHEREPNDQTSFMFTFNGMKFNIKHAIVFLKTWQ
jgi:hypothetical protein